MWVWAPMIPSSEVAGADRGRCLQCEVNKMVLIMNVALAEGRMRSWFVLESYVTSIYHDSL